MEYDLSFTGVVVAFPKTLNEGIKVLPYRFLFHVWFLLLVLTELNIKSKI
jgi:hypothetical protein